MKKLKILDGSVPSNYPTSLRAAVVLSVKFLEKLFEHLRRGSPESYSVEQMFEYLSLLSNRG